MAVDFLIFVRSPKLREDFAILRCRSLIKENEVTTGCATKKLIKRSHCESYKILLKAGDVDITHSGTPPPPPPPQDLGGRLEIIENPQ